MITEKDIQVYKSASEKLKIAQTTIVDRVDEVIRVVAKIFNRRNLAGGFLVPEKGNWAILIV